MPSLSLCGFFFKFKVKPREQANEKFSLCEELISTTTIFQPGATAAVAVAGADVDAAAAADVAVLFDR